MEQYFKKFPIVRYNNVLTRNLTERVAMVIDNKSPTNYYPYELKDELRADVVAESYYEDSYLDWLIYLTNGITDPYYDWYLYQEDFNSYLIKKYGSIEDSQQKILHYRNNWADDPINLLPSVFNSLPENLKKYYQPEFGAGAEIISYSRKQEDWQVNTNQTLTFSTTATFEVGDNVELVTAGESVGSGTITIAGTIYTLEHLFGDAPTISMTVRKKNTTTEYAITEIISHNYNIGLDEQYFWSPVYAYDFENEQNESKRFIYLLDSRFTMEVAEDIRQKLNSQ